MNVCYGYGLEGFLRPDLLQGQCTRGGIELSLDSKTFMRKLFDSDQGQYFVQDEAKKYVLDFEFCPVEKLINRLESGEEEDYVSEQEIFATCFKNPEKISFLVPLRSSDKQVLMVPDEQRRPRSDWGNKIALTSLPIGGEYPLTREYYMSDLASLLRDKIVTLVVRD